MFKKIAFGQLRHLITTFGGAFVQGGMITQDELTTITGAIMILAGLAWSALTPEKKTERTPLND